jgi:hypothetical protein
MTTRRASCNCGQLAVTCSGEPMRVSVCHCLACQRRTGSAYGLHARWKPEDIAVEGTASVYRRVGDAGTEVRNHFCATCGTTVYFLLAIQGTEYVGVPVGGFADPTFPPPRVTIYEARQHPWARLPDSLDLERYD